MKPTTVREKAMPTETTTDIQEKIATELFNYLFLKNGPRDALTYLREGNLCDHRHVAMVCDLVNGHLFTYGIGSMGEQLAMLVEDAMEVAEEYDEETPAEKWNLANEEVVHFAQLLRTDPEAARAVDTLVMWFWAGEPWTNKWVFTGETRGPSGPSVTIDLRG